MASFNVSAEDSTPLITYSPVGVWTDSPDSDAPLYSGGSFHTTSTQGASATFQFNGTGIWLFGAKRPNYGNFTITVDGKTFAGNAQNPTAVFEQLLGGISELQMGLHTVVFTNTGSGASLDLDSLTFETQVGNPGASVTNSVVDDSDPAWKYLPSASTWAVNTLQGTIQNGIHFTQTGGAQAQLTFTGDAVALFGTVSPDHANFTVSVDGKTQSLDGGSNGIVRELHIKTLLFFSNQFGPGQHTLIVTADPDEPGKQNTGRFMDVDAVTVWSANGGTPVSGGSSTGLNATSAPPSSSAISVSPTTSSSQTATPGAASSDSSSATATGMAIGITIAALVGIFLVVLLIFILRRRKKLKQKKFMYVAPSPRLPIQKPDPEDGFTGYKRQISSPRFDRARSTAVLSSSEFPATPRTAGGREMSRSSFESGDYDVDRYARYSTPEPAPPPTPSGFPKVL